MNLTQSVDDLWTNLVGLLRTAKVCFAGANGAADCSMVRMVLAALAGIVILAVAYTVFRNILSYCAAVKLRKADQVVASEDQMNEVRWQPGETQAEAQSQQALAAQIKKALRQRKETSA